MTGPTVPSDAVEAASLALAARALDLPNAWDHYDARSQQSFTAQAHTALTAALPVLRAEIANEIHAALYGKEGHIHQSLLDEVDAAIKRFPNMDAEWWIGGSAAVSVIDRWLARSFAETEGG
jgi:hypothetical protein